MGIYPYLQHLDLEEYNADSISIRPEYFKKYSNLRAAIGRIQLKKIDKIIGKRINHARYLTKNLEYLEGIQTPYEPADRKHTFLQYPLLVERNSRFKRNQLVEYLQKCGIETASWSNIAFPTLSVRESLGYKEGMAPNTEYCSNNNLLIPIYPSLTENELGYIAECIENFIKIYY